MERRDFIKNTLATAAVIGSGAAAGPLAREIGGKTKKGIGVGRAAGSGGGTGAPGGGGTVLPIRPPGALDEQDFLSRCIRCMRCVDACPNQAIVSLDESFGPDSQSTPAIKPRRQACMLCNKTGSEYLKCTEVCPSGALQKVRVDAQDVREKVKMGVAEIDFALCYSYNRWTCGACYHACPFPEEAMTLGMWEQPTVHAEHCVGCGLCERACIRYPQAIRINPAFKVSS